MQRIIRPRPPVPLATTGRLAARSCLLGAGALGALSLVAVLSPGCSSEVTCRDVCSCEGLDDDKLCIDSCEKARDDVEASAKAAGCAKQLDALSECQIDNASCDPQKLEYIYTIEECNAESAAFTKCSGQSSSASTGSN